MHEFPTYTRDELFADTVLHAVSVSVGFAAASLLMAFALSYLSFGAAASIAIYCTGMLAVFCFSAAYNLSTGPRRWLLRRCDHAAIYFKIAATYTPFAAIKMGGTAGFTLLGTVWAMAILGVLAKMAIPTHFVRTSYVLYLAQGWACLLTLEPLRASVSSTAVLLLLVGGVLYTVGVVFHLWERLRYSNAIWHGFVLAASACHFGAVVDALVI
jgi:hemolysin III